MLHSIVPGPVSTMTPRSRPPSMSIQPSMDSSTVPSASVSRFFQWISTFSVAVLPSATKLMSTRNAVSPGLSPGTARVKLRSPLPVNPSAVHWPGSEPVAEPSPAFSPAATEKPPIDPRLTDPVSSWATATGAPSDRASPTAAVTASALRRWRCDMVSTLSPGPVGGKRFQRRPAIVAAMRPPTVAVVPTSRADGHTYESASTIRPRRSTTSPPTQPLPTQLPPAQLPTRHVNESLTSSSLSIYS